MQLFIQEKILCKKNIPHWHYGHRNPRENPSAFEQGYDYEKSNS